MFVNLTPHEIMVEVEVEGEGDRAMAHVDFGGDQIKRLLVNLIDNAIHAITENFSPDGIKQVVISTSEIAERDALEISVSDTGPGIPATDRELIFSPYFSTRKRGTGLGLAIVSHIVAEHGGKIRVEDNLPHGARFVIELPSAKE